MASTSQQHLIERLERAGIRPSAQRVAIATYVLTTTDHPTADEVWTKVKVHFPVVSRATVYNTLQTFREHGLVQQLVLSEGSVVFDPVVEPHHHFVDDETGQIHDIPWTALRVGKVDELEGVEVREYMVPSHRWNILHRYDFRLQFFNKSAELI